MPYIEINGAHIYYEVFRDDPSTAGFDKPDEDGLLNPPLRANRAPILLIHGSTNTGQMDWSEVTPELARRYKVFVPDCRGHGKSNNPRMSYAFKEMADDTAGFVRAMGYERAHIIGHSNGGNVALVTLIEHPEVVQTCILQAANAFVTKYLIEREPIVFDPERVEREQPEWKHEMIAAHGEVNGKEYWRHLLRMTMQEIISEPNYSPGDLQRVKRPAFVIMGADDQVNAPDRHAQFIADHIPDAELWIPENTGHNVHKERRKEWLAKVLDFLERWGNE